MSRRGALLLVLLLGAAGFLAGVTRADPARAWGSYLVNFLFWSGLSQAAVAFLAILHLTKARWGEPLRASAESLMAPQARSAASASRTSRTSNIWSISSGGRRRTTAPRPGWSSRMPRAFSRSPGSS